MNRFILSLSAILLLTVGAHGQQCSMLSVKELKLQNGMTVWLNEDHTQPKVYGAVVVKAGAKDCPGTGIAHYFEHIMFKGTERIGTIDYVAERPWIDSISAQYDLLATTTDTKERTAIQTKINKLSLQAADYAIPNEFNRLISLYGGSNLNAATGMDVTFYHNTFLPQFMEQWCWLNSERMLKPVFRGFQAELENVYEEKNRSEDVIGGAMNKAMKAIFGSHPYGQPIIGTTESLKNPVLSEMKAFYEKYYVAQNMGLILCGDFQSDALLPLLEKTFGRIPAGEKPQRNIVPMPPIQSGTQSVKLPIPIIKAEALVFNGPTDYEKDAIILELCNQLLSNGNAGLLDSLMNEHDVLAAVAARTAFNDAGVQFMAVIPKIPFGSMKKAEARCLAQIERIKRGDFSEELLELLKRNMITEAEQSIETIDERSEKLLDAFSQGHSWQETLDQLDELRQVTKADVVRVANKFFNDQFIRLKKKFGTEKKESLQQPGYKPIEPKNTNAKSIFAKELEQLPVDNKELRFVDMEHDAERTVISPHITLYTKENPVNDIFTFTLRFLDGKHHTPLLEQLADYLSKIGTDSLSKQQLERTWQRLGVETDIKVENDLFSFTLTGLEEQLEPALQMLCHFLEHAKGDKEALSEMKMNGRVNDKSFGKTKDDGLPALLEYVRYGEKSAYLNQLSKKEVQQMTDKDMIDALDELQLYDCELIYCGRNKPDFVADLSLRTLHLDKATKEQASTYRRVKGYDTPTVFFYHVPKSRQNYVATYEQLPAAPTFWERSVAKLWAAYMGSGMSSVLFQNIRGFQSLAYSTYGSLGEPSIMRYADAPLSYVTVTGTQADKTRQAMNTLDSLMRNMPMNTENLKATRQKMLNDIQNDYPSFRKMANHIANLRMQGYQESPDIKTAANIPTLTSEEVADYHRQHVAGNQRVWIVIGDRKLTDFQELARYGEIKELKKADVFK